ncbi:unnamed protein product [Owenia fusiformis]|uniref:Uncharacterized protein n=1 Tax=Owenia fusiformis TaxID=6347 RepID=A0A8J1U0B5_OWEFU|nr:unnamed protein product [Owenia fusiformis]
MSDEEMTPRSKEMGLLKSILDSKSQSTISQSSLSSSDSVTQISSSVSTTDENSKSSNRSNSPLTSSNSSMESKDKKSSDISSDFDSDSSHDSKSYSSDSSDTVVLEDSAKSKRSNRRKHSRSETDSKSSSDLEVESNNNSKTVDDNDRYLTQRNRKFYSIEETEARSYEDRKQYDNQRDRPKSATVLHIENHEEHYDKFKNNRERRSQRPMSASSRLSSTETFDSPQRRPRRKLRSYKPHKEAIIYNAWEESVNDKLCQKYGELKDLLLHSLDIMQSIPNKNELLYDQKYKAAKKIIKKTLYVPNTVSMSPRDVPSYFRKSAKGRSNDSTRNSNSIYRNDSESPRSDASYSSNYDNDSVVSSNSYYSRVSASTDTSTLRGSKRVTFADDGGSLCSFDQSVTSDSENQIRGILKHKNKSNRRQVPHREMGYFTPPMQESSHRSRRKQLSMDDYSMIRSVSEEHLNRPRDRQISRSESIGNLDNRDNSPSMGPSNFGSLNRRRSSSPKRNKSPSRSVSLTSLNGSFDGSDHQLKNTDNPAVKKWLREKNKEHRMQLKQERLQKMNEQKREEDQRKVKDIKTLESQIQFHKWITNKQKELRIQKRHERIKPKPVEIVTPRKNTSPSGLRPASSYSGFAPKAPRAKKSGLPKRSSSMKKKQQEEKEKVKAAEETLKKKISYEIWLKQKQEDDAERRRSAQKIFEKLSKSADDDTKRVIADAAKRRFERVVDGKKTLDSGLKMPADDTRPTSAPPSQNTREGKYKWVNESSKNPERPRSARPQSPNKADRVSTSSQNPFKNPTPPTESKKSNSRRNKNSGMYYKPRDFNNFLFEEASGERPEPQGCDAPNNLPAHDTESETSSTVGEPKASEKSKRKKSKSDSGIVDDIDTDAKPLAIKPKKDTTFLTSIEA